MKITFESLKDKILHFLEIVSIRALIYFGWFIKNKDLLNEMLLFSASVGSIDLVTLSLKLGADIDTISSGTTALHIAIEKNHIGVVETLIHLGADKEIVDRDGRTPLLAAVSVGNLNIIQLLVAKGANINKREIVPLMFSLMNSEQVAFAYLIALIKNNSEIDMQNEIREKELLFYTTEAVFNALIDEIDIQLL